MKAKLFPIAMGAILAGGMTVAQADVTVMGHIDLAIDSVDVDGGQDDITLNCTTCSVGFKGSEDLGNGLKAIFKVDFQYDITQRNRASDGNDALFDRDQWLGLKGSNFGSIRVGTISTVWKSHGKILDPLYRTSLQGRDRGLQSGFHTGAGEEGQGRAEQTFRWDSPNWNGIKVGATYTMDSDEGDGENENPIGIGAKYSYGGMTGFADYYNNQQNGSDETSGWKVGGKYGMNDIALMAQYEDFKDGGDDFNIWHLAGSFTMGNNLVYLGYGQGENDSMTNGDYDVWTLAGVHSMSKRTSVYAGFSQADCDSGAGNTHKICSGVNGESDKFSLGMKHKF